MMASTIAKVLTELGPDLEKQFHYPGLLIRLRAEDRITEEEQQKVEIGATSYDKSRILLKTLAGKPDSALDTILSHFHEDKTLPHVEKLIYESAKKHGYFEQPAPASGNSSKRKEIGILPSKWWPEHKELIKTFVHRTTLKGVPLVEHVRGLLQLHEPNARALVVHKCVLVGMGGIGKSSTAKWYANTYQDEYDHIIWIDSDKDLLRGSFDRLARKLELVVNTSDELHHFVGDIYEKLGLARCLFIFDNAETFDGQNGLQKILPKQECHDALITSRTILWGNDTEFGQIPTVHLDFFSKEECLAIFGNALGDAGRQLEKDILDLAEQLGFLPLALQTAIATIKNSKQRYTVRSYLERIREDIKFLVQNKTLNDYERSISATLRISVEQIENEQNLDEDCRSLCKEILNLAACSRPDDIPEYLFQQIANTNKYEVDDALDALISYSLLSHHATRTIRWKYSFRTFSIHRLLQHVLIHGMDVAVLARPILEYAQRGLIACSDLTHGHSVQIWNVLRPKLQLNPEVLKEYAQFLCLLAYHTQYKHSTDYLEATLKMLRPVFQGEGIWEPLIEIRLIYAYAEEGNFTKAQASFEKLCETVGKLDHDRKSKELLAMHLELLHADIHVKMLSTSTQQADSVAGMQDIIDSYEKVLNWLKCTNYNGIIDGTPVYYNLLDQGLGFKLEGADYREMTFWAKVILNYARLLCQDIANDKMDKLAVGVLWERFIAGSPAQTDISFLYRLYRLLFPEKGPKPDDRIRKIYECAVQYMLAIDFSSYLSPMNEYNCELFWKIAPPYFRRLLRGGSDEDISHAVVQAMFLIKNINWPMEGMAEYLKHVIEVVDNLTDLNRLTDVLKISQIVLDKILESTPGPHSSNMCLRPTVLHAIFQLSTVYSYAFLKLEDASSSRNGKSLTEYDNRVLHFLQSNVSVADVVSYCRCYTYTNKILWVLRRGSEKSDFLTEFDPLMTKVVFNSKLSILLELIRHLKEPNAEFANIKIYDIALVYALVYLGRLEEATKLWSEYLNKEYYEKRAKSANVVLDFALHVGIRTLSLLQHELEIDATPRKLEFMDNIARITAEGIDWALECSQNTYSGWVHLGGTGQSLLVKWSTILISRYYVKGGVGLILPALRTNLIREVDIKTRNNQFGSILPSWLQQLRAAALQAIECGQTDLEPRQEAELREAIMGIDNLLDSVTVNKCDP